MKKILILNRLSVTGLLIIYLISFNLSGLESQSPLEAFFEDPISQFNTLPEESQFYIALYYLNLILKEFPDQSEEVLSSKSLSLLKSKKITFNSFNKNTLLTIEQNAQNSNLEKNINLSIYELVFHNIKNKQITKQLPHPDLFQNKYKKLNKK